MPALTEVGARYERGELFLPQLLQSANAAQAAFEPIRQRLPAQTGEGAGRVVLATVHGDVHDIGKNIVKVLLLNYGFAVTDLGKNVPPLRVLEAVRDTGARLVGLSALMTTTVPAMRETIELLKKEAPGVTVVVGGAVLTQAYADQIGADITPPTPWRRCAWRSRCWDEKKTSDVQGRDTICLRNIRMQPACGRCSSLRCFPSAPG